MATTSRGNHFPDGDDPVDVPGDIEQLAEDLNLAALYDESANFGAFPTSDVRKGFLRRALDTGVLYVWSGGAWVALNAGLNPDGPPSTATIRTLGAGAQQAAPGNDARLSDQRVPSNASVTASKVADALKPSAGAGNATEALRAIGTDAGQVAAGADSRFPTLDQKAALGGTSGAPAAGNPYVTSADGRLSDQRTPTDASVTAAKVAASLKPSGSAAAGAEALRALGTAAGTATAGDDTRLPQPGDIRMTARLDPATGWTFVDGVPRSRTDPATVGLFNAITRVQTCSRSSGSATLTVADSSKLQSGWPIEGTGIPAGTTIQSIIDATHVSMTNPASSSGSNFSVRFLPWGRGDGSTTFDLPSIPGRAPIGAGAGAGLTARSAGAKVGEEAHALTVGEMPPHDHGGVTGNTSINHAHQSQDGRPFLTDHAGVGGGVYDLSSGPDAGNPGGGFTSSADVIHGHPIGSQGGGGTHNTMQPSIAMNYEIKL